MAIQMTRAEYELKYGIAPVIPTSDIDTTPTPIRMTQAEYDAKYRPTPAPQPSTFAKIGNAINEFNPLYQIPKMAIEGAMKTSQGLGEALTAKTPTEAAKASVKTIAGATQGVLAIPFGAFEAVTNLPVVKQVKNFLWGTEPGQLSIANAIADKVSDLKPLQDLVTKYENSPEVAGDLITTILGFSGLKGLRQPKLRADIQAEFQAAYNKAKKLTIEPVEQTIATIREPIKARINENLSSKIEQEIATIEKQYVKTRKSQEFSKDENAASRKRISQTDVLVGAVDKDGVIRTKQKGGAVDQYREQTMAGAEGVVRQNLERLGEKVNLAQVEREMILQVNDARLPPGALVSALNGIKREIAGLRTKADEFDDVLLVDVHDAKINTTRGINYKKDSNPTIDFKKAKARTYRLVVEENSAFNVGEVNKELQKFEQDIELLESLDDLRVKGGKLGKYVAQISGNIVGGIAGGVVGGIPGSALGTVVGGEVGSALKGRSMAGTFGGERGVLPSQSEVLTEAKAQAGLPKGRDLRTPDEARGAPAGVPKTKEVLKLERDIRENVKQQKEAIKGNDFTLVQKLKEIYDILVEKLKAVIKEIKETPNKQGGFIKNPLAKSASKEAPGKGGLQSQKIGKSTSPDSTTPLSESKLVQEARKYKSVQELYKDLAFKKLKKQEEALKLRFSEAHRTNPGTASTRKLQDEWQAIKKQTGEMEEAVMNNERSIRETTIRNRDLELRKKDPSIDNLSKEETDFLLAEAKKATNKDEFLQTMHGSASQYGAYQPQLRKYVAPESKYLYEITDLKPDDTITVYRGIDGSRGSKINNGDFVTTDFADAQQYGSRVISQEVKAKHLINEYPDELVENNQFYELIYQTKPVKKITDTQLTDIWKQAQVKAVLPYKETGNLTTKILKDLEGKTTVSKQYILDATNRGELKQVERDITRQVLDTMPDGQINVKEFADKVKAELLPLKRVSAGGLSGGTQYEHVSLPEELKGKVGNYSEHIYESPIKTSAGKTHFSAGGRENYFGHTRIEDMADNKTRRVIEVQSDLYQKGNLESEAMRYKATPIDDTGNELMSERFGNTKVQPQGTRAAELAKLQQYNDPTAHFRMIREEIAKASQDGKTKLQFPTGETAMKIEGLGGTKPNWFGVSESGLSREIEIAGDLEIGQHIRQGADGENWIITDVLGDGKFKAVPKDRIEEVMMNLDIDSEAKALKEMADSPLAETFDISGKVDTNNPIYKFYEKDIQKYLNKFDGKKVIDDKGVQWIEVPIKKEYGDMPVEAFAKLNTKTNVA